MESDKNYVFVILDTWTNVKTVEIDYNTHRLLDSLVVECWLRVWEVPGSIPSQGPRHTKDVIKMGPVVLFLKN